MLDDERERIAEMRRKFFEVHHLDLCDGCVEHAVLHATHVLENGKWEKIDLNRTLDFDHGRVNLMYA